MGSIRRNLASTAQSGASIGDEEGFRFLQDQRNLAHCSASSEEAGLHLDAVSGFVHHASNVAIGQYVFAYNMRFTNLSPHRLRVLARQYEFRDASGAVSSQIKSEQPEAAGV